METKREPVASAKCLKLKVFGELCHFGRSHMNEILTLICFDRTVNPVFNSQCTLLYCLL